MGVLSGIHTQFKYISSTVYLHQNKSIIEGLVKRAYLLFSFFFNTSMEISPCF